MPSTRAQAEGVSLPAGRQGLMLSGFLLRFKIRVWRGRMYQNVAFLGNRRQKIGLSICGNICVEWRPLVPDVQLPL